MFVLLLWFCWGGWSEGARGSSSVHKTHNFSVLQVGDQEQLLGYLKPLAHEAAGFQSSLKACICRQTKAAAASAAPTAAAAACACRCCFCVQLSDQEQLLGHLKHLAQEAAERQAGLQARMDRLTKAAAALSERGNLLASLHWRLPRPTSKAEQQMGRQLEVRKGSFTACTYYVGASSCVMHRRNSKLSSSTCQYPTYCTRACVSGLQMSEQQLIQIQRAWTALHTGSGGCTSTELATVVFTYHTFHLSAPQVWEQQLHQTQKAWKALHTRLDKVIAAGEDQKQQQLQQQEEAAASPMGVRGLAASRAQGRQVGGASSNLSISDVF